MNNTQNINVGDLIVTRDHDKGTETVERVVMAGPMAKFTGADGKEIPLGAWYMTDEDWRQQKGLRTEKGK